MIDYVTCNRRTLNIQRAGQLMYIYYILIEVKCKQIK